MGAHDVDLDTLITSELDVYAPCALGGALNDESVARLRAKAVVGAANNQRHIRA